MLTIGRKTKIVFCPKLILLERYGYVGPVKEADGFYYKWADYTLENLLIVLHSVKLLVHKILYGQKDASH